MKGGKGLGTIKYSSTDSVPMNEQKEKYLLFYNYYIERGKRIAVTLEVLDYLTTHEQDYNNIATISPAFMTAVINNFWLQAIIDLDAFYYKNNDLSFQNFFNYIKSNWNLIFAKEFFEEIHYSNSIETREIKFSKKEIFNTIAECESVIEQNKADINNLRKFRDNVAAHYADVSSNELTVSLEQLIKVFQITEQIINKIGVFYDRVATALKPINAGDIYQTCYAIKKYKEYRSMIRELDLQKMNAKIGENK